MATVRRDGSVLRIETNRYYAAVQTEGYVSGVKGGSFVDKSTGACDLGFGLCIVDFLLEPGHDDDSTPPALRYHGGNLVHGHIPKRYVELPQICTQAKQLTTEIVDGDGFIAVRQEFTWTVAGPPYKPGSRWEQWLVFPDGARWFLAYDRIASVNTVNALMLRIDMPGHVRHNHGCIPSQEFLKNFRPDARYLYRREVDNLPQRFIRAYQLRNGLWLAGMTLEPSVVYEAWCHQRDYVCMIQEIGGRRVKTGESFGAVHLVGWFEDLSEMEQAFDAYKGATALHVKGSQWCLER